MRGDRQTNPIRTRPLHSKRREVWWESVALGLVALGVVALMCWQYGETYLPPQ